MRLDQLQYDLPEERIAQRPLEPRDAARLLCLDIGRDQPHAPAIRHERIRALPRLLPPSLWVLNNTRVLAASLLGRKSSGGRVQLLLLECEQDATSIRSDMHEQRWHALGRASKPLRPGTRIVFDDSDLEASIEELLPEGLLAVRLRSPAGVGNALAGVGRMPLPPYIRRPADERDAETYQTVFASEPGAVAAPTAGLHFTEALLAELPKHGHRLEYVTLHVGPGTFTPVRAESLAGHRMHGERYVLSDRTARALREAKREGMPVLAVGTTAVRALEAAASETELVRAGSDRTRLFIYPPYQFRVVDSLLTNFHLPRSTLLALVMAFAGREPILRAYREAVAQHYRFFSYGDAMLLHRGLRDGSQRTPT